MMKAAVAWIVIFAISAVLARGGISQTALQLTMPFPAYDDNAIYNQVKARAFSRAWLFSTLLGASLVAAAMLVDDFVVMLLLSFAGISLIAIVTAVQSYRLFRVALLELQLPWPPVG
jgi:hypothetical protein